MVDGLLSEKDLILHASCTPELPPSQRHDTALSQISCSIDITVYGPLEFFDEIGDWFQDYDMFLQDPRACNLDVRYLNPHRLSSDKFNTAMLVSQVIMQSSTHFNFQEIYERPDLLDLISGQENLEEAAPSSFLNTVLHR